MPSYKSSMLSLMVLHYFYSLVGLMILAALMAMFSPDSYKLISEEKLAVIIILGAYITLWAWLFAAYLQRSQITDNNKASESTSSDVSSSTTTTTTTTPKEDQAEMLSEEDNLSLTKSEVNDTTNQ